MTQNESFHPVACVVLAAGQGTRMKSNLPKVLHQVAGMPMVKHVTKVCEKLCPEHVVVVINNEGAAVQKAVAPFPCVVQANQLGTGDAVKAASGILRQFKGDIIVLFADSPLMTEESLRLMQRRRKESGAAVVVAGFETQNPASYGRLIVDASGRISKIVEASEATSEQLKIKLCNGGAMLFDSEKLWPMLESLRNDNAKGEYFLTDCVALAQEKGDDCVVAIISEEEVAGVNTRLELAAAEKITQRRLREKAMLNGVTMIDPETVFLSKDTQIGKDVVIEPNVIIGAGVTIEDNVEIRAFSHINGATIKAGAIIGPFARLRPSSIIGENAHIGNFVEIKNSELGNGAKANHLSYVGDATVGSKTNIGAGTITANYDGYSKHRTKIGENVGTGSNSVLVAPVEIGDGAYIAAGSVITGDVPADALAVSRARQENKAEWAKRIRESRSKT